MNQPITIENVEDQDIQDGHSNGEKEKEEEDVELSTEDEDDLFTVEEDPHCPSVIHPSAWTVDSDDSTDSTDSYDAVSLQRKYPLNVVAEVKMTQDSNTIENDVIAMEEEEEEEEDIEKDVETMVNEKEEKLVTAIQSTSPNSQKRSKLQMKLASLYQENGFFSKAIQQYQQVVKSLERSLQYEDIYHYALRCLAICLREQQQTERSIDVLNKDIDVLVFRKSRNNNDYREYYDCELQRSYEELGNSYITYFSLFLLHHSINHSINHSIDHS